MMKNNLRAANGNNHFLKERQTGGLFLVPIKKVPELLQAL